MSTLYHKHCQNRAVPAVIKASGLLSKHVIKMNGLVIDGMSQIKAKEMALSEYVEEDSMTSSGAGERELHSTCQCI